MFGKSSIFEFQSINGKNSRTAVCLFPVAKTGKYLIYRILRECYNRVRIGPLHLIAYFQMEQCESFVVAV